MNTNTVLNAKDKHSAEQYTVANMRPDIKGKLLAEGATSLDDQELHRVFDGVVLVAFCIKEAQKARTAGITVNDIILDSMEISNVVIMPADRTKMYVGQVVMTTGTEIWQEVDPRHVVIHERAGLGPLPLDDTDKDNKLNGLLISVQYNSKSEQKIMPAGLRELHNDMQTCGEIIAETDKKYIQALGRCEYAAHNKEAVGALQLNHSYTIKYSHLGEVQVSENTKGNKTEVER